MTILKQFIFTVYYFALLFAERERTKKEKKPGDFLNQF